MCRCILTTKNKCVGDGKSQGNAVLEGKKTLVQKTLATMKCKAIQKVNDGGYNMAQLGRLLSCAMDHRTMLSIHIWFPCYCNQYTI